MKPQQPLDEIRRRGLAALAKELGPEGLVWFIRSFATGSGDYTAERHAWMDKLGMDEIAESILKAQRGSDSRTRRKRPNRKSSLG